jgi:hypothetical protein
MINDMALILRLELLLLLGVILGTMLGYSLKKEKDVD